MKTLDWLNSEIEKGSVCEAYTSKAKGCYSKKQLFDLACDINGAQYLCESKTLDIDVIEKEFANFINGRCKNTIVNTTDGEYTSAIYCKHNENVYVDTTLTTFLGCKGKVELKEYGCFFLFIDSTSDLIVYCPPTTMVKVETYNGGKVNVVGEGKIKVIHK